MEAKLVTFRIAVGLGSKLAIELRVEPALGSTKLRK
jgi:hypothetical protein